MGIVIVEVVSAILCSGLIPPKVVAFGVMINPTADPTLKIHGLAIMAGPEAVPPDFFTPEHRARVLGDTP